jgi:D-cysteine desulfhydrase
VARLAGASLRLLRRHAPDVPRLSFSPGDFDWVSDQLGEGYGSATPAAREARDAAAEHGVALETTYSAKALAGLRADARRGILAGPTLFWNTYNAVDVGAALAPLPEPSQLPRPFQRFFDGGA